MKKSEFFALILLALTGVLVQRAIESREKPEPRRLGPVVDSKLYEMALVEDAKAAVVQKFLNTPYKIALDKSDTIGVYANFYKISRDAAAVALAVTSSPTMRPK